MPAPPSLQNIFKEIESDLGRPVSRDPDLSRWARQGVLLLNATLTVRAGQAGSHQNKGWELFTDAAVSALTREREGLVFLLWGNYARRKGANIDRRKHLVLESAALPPRSSARSFLRLPAFFQSQRLAHGAGEDADRLVMLFFDEHKGRPHKASIARAGKQSRAETK